jgi:thiol:disulfide interchange protein DsbG
MTFRTLYLTVAWVLAFALTACSKQDSTHVKAVAPEQIFETVVNQGKGFTAGSIDSTTVAYAIFDPSCGHCAALWRATRALNTVKFVWIPVAIMRSSGKSTRQGAALLASPSAAALMDEHEASVLAGTGGIAIDTGTSESKAAVQSNTSMFEGLGIEGVPFIVAKNIKTGQVVTHAGTMTTGALATLLGLDTL